MVKKVKKVSVTRKFYLFSPAKIYLTLTCKKLEAEPVLPLSAPKFV